MILTDQQKLELEVVTDEAVKFLNDNFHPHVKIIITPTGVELLESSAGTINHKHLRD